ncbi:MAG: M24 family metallopeptidase, partial [Alphaproteobacteria bacterium]|nr:M24 family metallopeptidase [Alphaproteobacteria bacterium]
KNYQGKTELDIVAKLNEFRQSGENYFSNSFDTIAGYASNSAIIHYHPTENTNLSLQADSLLLLDSGAQYLDGTTDITRTIALGSPSDGMIHDYTLVLKSHIALANAYFPEGTTGLSLDAIARAPLWKYGKNYSHGTGHGVGFFLNVHEGPCSISSRNGNIPLSEHMITSIEPGYYKENHYGIRIENLAQVVRISNDNFEQPTLGFEPLTLVPLDKNLINKHLLTQDELMWLNNYHQTVFEKLSPLLNNQEQEWLRRACSAIDIK